MIGHDANCARIEREVYLSSETFSIVGFSLRCEPFQLPFGKNDPSPLPLSDRHQGGRTFLPEVPTQLRRWSSRHLKSWHLIVASWMIIPDLGHLVILIVIDNQFQVEFFP